MRTMMKCTEFLLMIAIVLAMFVMLGACGDPSDEAPPDVCEASAFEFCDRAIECGQIRETARSDCEAWIVKGYCVAPGEWSQCEDALDELSCPVNNVPIERACWNVQP